MTKVTIFGCDSTSSTRRTEIELDVDADPANAASHRRVRAMYDALKKRYAIVEIHVEEKG
jgi:anti-sigma factor RsiW